MKILVAINCLSSSATLSQNAETEMVDRWLRQVVTHPPAYRGRGTAHEMVSMAGGGAPHLAACLPLTACRSERPIRAQAAAISPARASAARRSAVVFGRSA